jgi:MscS family membrane protein
MSRQTRVCRFVLFISLFFQWNDSSGLGAQKLPTAVKAVAGQNAPAQSTSPDSTPKATFEPLPPVDPLRRTSPHGCVLGFLRAAEAKDFERLPSTSMASDPRSKARSWQAS